MNFDLRQDARSRTLITAHRGVAGGNIPCNTLAAFDAALRQGADMIELDVSRTADGELFIFHPGMEPAHLCIDNWLDKMTADEVRQLHFRNQDRTETQYPLATLDEALEYLKGRCYINVDKYWSNVAPITEAIRRHNMVDQVLVKSAYSDEVVRMMEEVAPDLNFMLILRRMDEHTEHMMKRKLNYVGVEALFTTDDEPICSPEYTEWMHQNGLMTWANSIVYNYRDVIAGTHTDDRAVVGNEDDVWGWMIDRGFDVIQTDWPLALRCYLNSRKEK